MVPLTLFYHRTDLDMYRMRRLVLGLMVYSHLVTELLYIEPTDYPSTGIDIQTKIDEHRIVGPTGGEVGITLVYYNFHMKTSNNGDGSIGHQQFVNESGGDTSITTTLSQGVEGLDVDTHLHRKWCC